MRAIAAYCAIGAIATGAGCFYFASVSTEARARPAQPTTNEATFRTVLTEAKPLIDECRLRRQRGELPTFAASAECSNRVLIAAFNAAHYKYIDLIKYLAAKRLEVAEKIDRNEVTQDQARQVSMEIMMHIITTVRERDSASP